jgi:hypothetical protein
MLESLDNEDQSTTEGENETTSPHSYCLGGEDTYPRCEDDCSLTMIIILIPPKKSFRAISSVGIE